MTIPLIVIGASLLLMLLSIIFNWKLKIGRCEFSLYWIIILVCAIVCVATGFVSGESFKNVFVDKSDINPVKILIIFLSCTSLSVLLDKIGFFKWIALLTAQKAKASQTKLFFTFSAIVALLTIFTSNDILILTFTPFICYFTKRAKINPIPYIMAEFVMANVWSMFFFFDNPTDIYLCTSYGITFVEYFLKMWLPTLVAGAVSISLVYLLFRKQLKQPLALVENKGIKKPPKTIMIMALTGLFTMIGFMALAPYLNMEIWYTTLFACGMTYIVVFVYLLATKQKLKVLGNALKNLPYEIIPFLLSMGVIVATLEDVGFMQMFANWLDGKSFFLIGIIAFFLGNLINNIPMTMLFTSVLGLFASTPNMIYAVVISSNVCAFLTPVGALAGIMFMKILKDNKVKFTFAQFMGYGVIISIPTLLCTLGSLLIF